MKKKIASKAFKAAFPHTLPILTGYMFLGIAYGFLMKSKGFGLAWTAFASITIFSGTMQYVGLVALTSAFNPLYILLLTFMVNARHVFYGISMLERYRDSGKLKFPTIFCMADEAFSINCSTNPPEGIDKGWFYFFISFLNYSYWVMYGCVGNLLGSFLNFNVKGLDFVLTALFVVIFINQWLEKKDHTAALLGLLCSFVCLVIFNADGFMIPSMLAILTSLLIARKKIEKSEAIQS